MRVPKPKIRKPLSRRLKQRAWDLQSELIRRSEGGKCFTCDIIKPWKEMQAGHYIHKECLDFNRKNIHCQCVGCNKWRSGNREEYALRLEKKYGYGILQELKTASYEDKYWKVAELKELIEQLKAEINEISY